MNATVLIGAPLEKRSATLCFKKRGNCWTAQSHGHAVIGGWTSLPQKKVKRGRSTTTECRAIHGDRGKYCWHIVLAGNTPSQNFRKFRVSRLRSRVSIYSRDVLVAKMSTQARRSPPRRPAHAE